MKERIINIGPRLKQRRKEMRIKQTEMAKELRSFRACTWRNWDPPAFS